MRKSFLALLLFASPVLAQTTQTAVSGTIVDPNGVPYYPATVTACLTPVTTNPIVNGLPVNPNQGANYCLAQVQTTPTGFFLRHAWPNAGITPGGTQWTFSVSATGSGAPAGKGPQNFQVNITISGATQDVGATLSASAPVLLNSGAGAGTGSGSVGSPTTPAAPAMAFYLGNCASGNTGQCFSTFADTQQSQACSWTAATPSTVTCGSQLTLVSGSVTTNVATYSTNTIWQNSLIPTNWVNGNSITVTGFTGGDTFLNQTCTLTAVTTNSVSCALTHANASSTTQGIITNTSVGPFVAADVGKQVMGWQSCRAFDTSTVMGSNAITVSGAPLVTSFISQTQVQITTAANAQVGQTGCFIWGHPDDTGAAAVEASYVNAPYCPKLMLQASNYLFTKPHFYTNPAACASEGTSYPSNAGNVFYSAGFELEGRGTGNTVIYLATNFPNGDPCNRGQNGVACFNIPQLGRWKDFQITGGSQPSGNITGTPKALVFGVIATVSNVTCTNYGAYLTGGQTLYGFQASYQVQFDQYNNSGCGSVGLDIITGTGAVTARWTGIENNVIANVSVDGPGIGGNGSSTFTCYDCKLLGSQNNSLSNVASFDILNFGGWVTLYRAILGSGAGGIGASTTLAGYQGNSSGSILYARDTVFSMITGISSTSILCAAVCTNYLSTTKLTHFGTGKDYIDFAGSLLYDQCGNGIGSVTVNGNIVGSCSIAGAFLNTGGVGLTSGWGTSSVASVTAGSDSHAGSFTITGAAGSANPTLTLTFPVAYLVAPSSCTLSFGSAGATTDFTNVFASTPGTTSVVFNLIGTSTAVSIVFDYRCGP